VSDDDLVGWVTIGQARAAWPDGAKMTEPRLSALLTAAHEMCTTYAPALPDAATPVPQRWKEAQVLEARAIFTASRAGGAGQVGIDGEPQFSITAPTLSGQIMQLLRPPAGPQVG
jgi:hypothetical protein